MHYFRIPTPQTALFLNTYIDGYGRFDVPLNVQSPFLSRGKAGCVAKQLRSNCKVHYPQRNSPVYTRAWAHLFLCC